jgi:Xaa-Pro aminopeptidase
MFQTFDTPDLKSHSANRIALLRQQLTEQKLDGFLVPRSDEHQGEYVPPGAERLAWLTGFTGSAGLALVLEKQVLLFVDGRYTLQAADQVDTALVTPVSSVETPLAGWLADNASDGMRIGFDPWLQTVNNVKALQTALAKHDASALPLARNLVDAIWTDRPAPPLEPVSIQRLEHAGVLARDKLGELAEAVAKTKADAAVLTDPSSIAWAFNIRGRDVPHTPLALGFALIRADGNHQLFMDKRKLPRETEAYLTQLATLCPPAEFNAALTAFGASRQTLMLDPDLAADAIRSAVTDAGGKIVEAPDPARLPRACKNAVELEGARSAHRRDGAAMATFLCWLDQQTPASVTEIVAAKQLEASRSAIGERMQMPLRDISFDTISGSGPNGAIVHYRVTERTNRTLADGELFLIDSGGQYEDGTTDITRTIAIGEPTAEMRDRFTRVLKGMIALSLARFPAGTRGMDIDVLARNALWQAGCDYAHGTGHGVGAFLSVHEGPQNISKRGTQALKSGMILSNEPGYYKPGAYGIRIENLVIVTEPQPIGGDIAMHGFATLTLCPIDRRLIETGLLVEAEIDWMDHYHARVRAEISPLVDDDVKTWLEAATTSLRGKAPALA